jgi:hemerythrin-like domain-containing protein
MAVAQQDTINFAVMYATHDAFRRDLDRLNKAIEAGRARTPEVRAGWDNFARQLHVHHSVEDADLWPRVEQACADRPDDLALMGEMAAEHAKLGPLMTAVENGLESGSPDLAERARELTTVLEEHMRHEEEEALPLIQRTLTKKDWGVFRNGMAKAQGPKGGAIYIPWIMDGVDQQGRDAFLAEMPGPVRIVNKLILEPRYQKRHLWGM